MPRPRRITPMAPVLPLLVALLVALPLVAPAAAGATGAARSVAYRGLRLVVPAAWPVIRLNPSGRTCVRFDRHAVYLGSPSRSQVCPAHVAGRTEAILVQPLTAGAASVRPSLSAPGAAEIQLVRHGLLVTATWNARPWLIERSLGLSGLKRQSSVRAARATPRGKAAADSVSGSGGAGTGGTSTSATTTTTTTTTPASTPTPGGVYTGSGFDACSAPNSTQMSDWSSSPYRALGVYIGGANMACSQANLTSSWVAQQAAAGWHLIPTYVGLQAPGNSCGCAAISSANAAQQGAAAAQDAIAQAQAIGLGSGNPIYYDMEAYSRTSSTSSTVLSFLGAWTSTLHASGYVSGVYSSSDSGIADLVTQEGTAYQEPDDIWIAAWNRQNNTYDANVPSTDWANHQRLHQNQGAHNETYGGATINIDGDYLDGATAAPSGAVAAGPPPPQLEVQPAADGTISLTPSWSGGSAAEWQILAGSSASSLGPYGSPVTASRIVVHSALPYFAVQALDAAGQVLSQSAAVPTPSYLAMYGGTVYVSPRGVGGLPVSCFGEGTCWLRTTISRGHSTFSRTGFERVRGQGVTYFSVSSTVLRELRSAAGHRLAVRVTLADGAGHTAVRVLNLVAFTTLGASPRRSVTQGASMHVVGLTAFASHGWTGGILSGCVGTLSCHATARITAFGHTIATAGSQALGASELGYLYFTLNREGHHLLLGEAGNQLPASVTLTSQQAGQAAQITTASIAIVAF